MSVVPKLIQRGEGWMLAVPNGYTMKVCDANQLMDTDQAFIVIRKKV